MTQQMIDQAKAVMRRNDCGTYTVPTHGLYPFQWNWDSALSALGFAHFDELRIATTFDEVIGISPPEEEIERRITAISRDDVSGMLTLHWTSQAGETFGIYWSTDLKTFYPDMHQSIPANPTAAETSFGPIASPAPNADRLFLRIGPPDIEPPTLAAISGDGIEITLAYSEPMIEGSATDPANYSLVLVGGGAIGVLSARLGETPGTVILTVAENLVFGVGYRLSVAGVTDPGGLVIAAGTEADFSPWNPGTGVVPLIISEFMAANSASPRNTEVLSDEDGETSDWIEIHNPLGAAVDLEGWFLTDNASNLTKWRFPAVSLAPGARLLVFASGKERMNPAARLHTNFQLSGSGYLGLVMPDGQTVAFGFAPAYPAQVDGVSFGLPEGSAAGVANYRYFDTPTPELANGASGYSGIVADTKFDIHRGFYESPFDLEISTATTGATIRYTTDMSDPSLTNGTTASPGVPIQIKMCGLAKKPPIETNIDKTKKKLALVPVTRLASSSLPAP